MSANNGYIGRSPGDSAVIVARESFTPGAATTDFTMSSGYTVGYVDCYLNGSRLINGTDFTASNGTTVGLTSFAQSGDVVELVAYKAFNLGQSIDQITGNLRLDGKLTVTGISSLTDVVSSGIITADSFSGNLGPGAITISDTTASTTTTTGALIVSGGVGIAKSLFIGEGVSIAGTITYNDVTNIDSVGIVTAGGGIRIGTGGTVGPSAAGVVTYFGDGSNLTGISTAAVPGISTQLHSVFGTINASGIITASAFKGDGSTLSNVGGDTDITSCLFI